MAPATWNDGESSVVVPPSTSASPAVPPALPLPVTKQSWPGAAVWSSSGWTGWTGVPYVVPTGSARSHWPLVAVSPGRPSVQPRSCSASSNQGPTHSSTPVTTANCAGPVSSTASSPVWIAGHCVAICTVKPGTSTAWSTARGATDCPAPSASK